MSGIRAYLALEGKKLSPREKFNKYSGMALGVAAAAAVPIVAVHGLISLLGAPENWKQELAAWGASTALSLPISLYAIRRGFCAGYEAAYGLYMNRTDDESTAKQPNRAGTDVFEGPFI